MAAIIEREGEVWRWIASRKCEFLAIKLPEKLEKLPILLNTGIEGQCVFFMHFIDRVFLRRLVNSTKILSNLVLCLSMYEHMEENTQLQATKGPNEQTKTPGYMLTLYFELCLYFSKEKLLISCKMFFANVGKVNKAKPSSILVPSFPTRTLCLVDLCLQVCKLSKDIWLAHIASLNRAVTPNTINLLLSCSKSVIKRSLLENVFANLLKPKGHR